MRTRVIFSIVTFVFMGFASILTAQNVKTGWEVWGLQGKIKSINESTYTAVVANNEVKKGKKTSVSTYTFNKKGNMIQDSGYLHEGKSIYIFDDKNNWLEITGYNPNGSFKEKSEFKYNSSGNLIESAARNFSGNLVRKQTYKNNGQGLTIEANYINSDGNLSYKETYKYNNKKEKIEENNYNPEGYLESKSTYTYDSMGNEMERKKEYFNSDGTPSTLFFHFHTKYNDQGQKIESISYELDGSMKRKSTYKYYYDKNKNWIKKIESENNNPISIAERSITYF